MKKQTWNYSDLKSTWETIAEITDFESNYIKDVLSAMISESRDFEINDYRFIHESDIDTIQVEEMSSDAYMLGCFNADFISDNARLSYNIVKALQEGEKFEELGQYLLDNEFVGGMQSEYSRLDGYGHHFSPYDGNEHACNDYLIFRIN